MKFKNFPKYKISAYDFVNDIYILKKKIFWFLYRDKSAGSKEKLENWIKNNK